MVLATRHLIQVAIGKNVVFIFRQRLTIVTNKVNSKVNIRQSPGLKSQVILQLRRGDGVRAVSRQGDWVRCRSTKNC
ncbi:MAG: SH3 domain-containing protein [Cyanobacteria bacterium J06592_8]